MKPWAPLDATVPSVSRPTSAHTVKPIMSSRDSDLTSLLFSCSASSVVSSTSSPARLPGPSDPSSSLMSGAREPTPVIGGAHPPERRDRRLRMDGQSNPSAVRARSAASRRSQAVPDRGVVLVLDAALQRGRRRGLDAAVQLAQLGQALGQVAARGPRLELGQRGGRGPRRAAARPRGGARRRRPGARAARAPRRPARRRGRRAARRGAPAGAARPRGGCGARRTGSSSASTQRPSATWSPSPKPTRTTTACSRRTSRTCGSAVGGALHVQHAVQRGHRRLRPRPRRPRAASARRRPGRRTARAVTSVDAPGGDRRRGGRGGSRRGGRAATGARARPAWRRPARARSHRRGRAARSGRRAGPGPRGTRAGRSRTGYSPTWALLARFGTLIEYFDGLIGTVGLSIWPRRSMSLTHWLGLERRVRADGRARVP